MRTKTYRPTGTNLFAVVFFGVALVVFALTYRLGVSDGVPGVVFRNATDSAIVAGTGYAAIAVFVGWLRRRVSSSAWWIQRLIDRSACVAAAIGIICLPAIPFGLDRVSSVVRDSVQRQWPCRITMPCSWRHDRTVTPYAQNGGLGRSR